MISQFIEEDHLYIVMEYAEQGDLSWLIQQQREKKRFLSEKDIWNYAWSLAMAVLHLHAHNIIHRDLKAMNVFIKGREIKVFNNSNLTLCRSAI